MTRPPFYSSRLKIKRAKEHFNALYGDFEKFIHSKPYEIRQELDSDSPDWQVVYYPTASLPSTWSVVLGELIYDLRSALDHVIYEIGPARRCEFPIFDDPNIYFASERKSGNPTKNSGLYKIRGITHQGTRDIIEAVQPFRIWQKDGEISVLWLLQELCNIDKHRSLNLCRRQTRLVEIDIQPGIRVKEIGLRVTNAPALENRAILARYTPLFPSNEVGMDVKITFEIAFDEGEIPQLTGEPVSAVCRAIIEYVERVIGLVETSMS